MVSNNELNDIWTILKQNDVVLLDVDLMKNIENINVNSLLESSTNKKKTLISFGICFDSLEKLKIVSILFLKDKIADHIL